MKNRSRQLKPRKGHSSINPRLKGRKKEFVLRAFKMGNRDVLLLSKLTGLPVPEIRHIFEEARFKARASGSYIPKTPVERMLLNGELTRQEISRLTGISRKRINNARHNLKKQGITTKVSRSTIPPAKIARIVLRFEILKQISGEKSILGKAEAAEVQPDLLRSWLNLKPELLREIKTLNNGKYWEKAKKDLRHWIKAQEKRAGKKLVY